MEKKSAEDSRNVAKVSASILTTAQTFLRENNGYLAKSLKYVAVVVVCCSCCFLFLFLLLQ
jgi:hypothetical protein